MGGSKYTTVTTIEDSYMSSLSRNSHHEQNQIKKKAAEINAMQAKFEKAEVESSKLREMLYPRNSAQAIPQAVSSLQIKSAGKQTTTGNQPAGKAGSVEKLFLEVLKPSQLSPETDGSWNQNCFAGILKILVI